MTRLRGMIWKTPWSRKRTPVASVPVPMWFFSNFGAGGSGVIPNSTYHFAAAAPAPGATGIPFWVGQVSAFDVTQVGLVQSQVGFVNRGWENIGRLLSFNSANSLETEVQAGPSLLEQPPTLGATLRAIVSLMTVEPVGPDTQLSLYVDGTLRKSFVFPGTYMPPVALLNMAAFSLPTDPVPPYIHGWAGGGSVPTVEEIQQWFLDTRYNTEVADIPGKTTDRISATSVAPLAPPVLPNLAGGQPMTYVVPVPPDPVAINSLINVTFAY